MVIRNENPKFPVEPTVVVPPEIHLSLHRQVRSETRCLRFWPHLRMGLVQAVGLVPAVTVALSRGAGHAWVRDGEEE